MTRLLRRCWLGLWLAVGCGSPDSAEPTAAPAPELPLAAAEAALATACAASDLAKAACQGSWRYHTWQTCPVSGAVSRDSCVNGPSCQTWNECQDWRFGASGVRQEVRTFEHRFISENRNAGNACTAKQAEINAALEELRAALPAEQRAAVKVLTSVDTKLRHTNEGAPCPVFCDDEYYVYRKCDVTYEVPVAARRRAQECGCQTEQCASPACGASSAPAESATGLTLPQVRAAVPALASSPAPVCSTCDELPVGTAAEIQAKADCLMARRASATPTELGALDARLRSLLLVAGDRLNEEQREAAVHAFGSLGDDGTLACEGRVAPPALPTNCEQSVARSLKAELLACEQVAAGVAAKQAAAASVAWTLGARCVRLLERVTRALPSGAAEHACVAPESAEGRLVLERVLGSAQQVIRGGLAAIETRAALGLATGPRSERYPELERTLWVVSRWWLAERAIVSALDGGSVQRAQRDLVSALGEFWEIAHRARGTLIDLERSVAAGQDVAAALAVAAARAEVLDRDVLLAAVGVAGRSLPAVMTGSLQVLAPVTIEGPRVEGQVLLELVSSALTGLESPLERREPFHDLGCRAAGCGAGTGFESTLLSALWRAIAAIDHPGGPGDSAESLAVAAARLPAGQPWRDVFLALSGQQEALRRAIGSALSDAGVAAASTQGTASARLALEAIDPRVFFEVPGGVEPPVSLVRLAALVRGARERADRYLESGLLGVSSRERLHANVSVAGREATVEAVQAALRALSSDVDRFTAERQEAVGLVLQRTGAERAREAGEFRLRELERSLSLVEQDALGVAATLAAADRDLVRVQDRLQLATNALDGGQFVPVGSTRRWVFHGHDARSALDVESAGASPESFAVIGVEVGGSGLARVVVDGPRLVTLSAEGEYSALCSVRRNGVGISGVSAEPRPGTTIGPEGVLLTTQAQNQQTKTRDSGTGLAIVAGVVRSIPVVGNILGSVLGALGSSNKKQRSSSASTSVAFRSGLRLPATPFPEAPAGALLIAELPRGATSAAELRALHLVERPATSFVVAEDADLYFVINDEWRADSAACQALSPAGDASTVTVNVRMAQPATQTAELTARALAEVGELLWQRRADYLAQGRLLPTQLGDLRLLAESEVQNRLGVSVSELPAALRQVVEAYVQRQLTALDATLELEALERRAEQLKLEAVSVRRELTLLEQGVQATSLLPVWRLRGFDEFVELSDDGSLTAEEGLIESVSLLSGRVSETLLPILELWHPTALAEVRGRAGFRRLARSLSSVAPDTDAITLVTPARDLLTELIAAYEADPITKIPAPNQPIVALSFPRPLEWRPSFLFAGEMTSASGMPTADAERATEVWNAIESAMRAGEPVCSTFAVGSRSARQAGGATAACTPVTCQSDLDCRDGAGVRLPGTQCRQGRCARAPTRVSFEVLPSDVYRRGGGQAVLPCSLTAAVVQQWGFVFASEGFDAHEEFRTLSLSGRNLDTLISPRQPFVTLSGQRVTYELTDVSAQETSISLLYAADERPYEVFEELAAGNRLRGRNPVGISALSKFDVDFAPLAGMRHSYGDGLGETSDHLATELLLFLRLDAQTARSADVALAVEACRSTLF